MHPLLAAMIKAAQSTNQTPVQAAPQASLSPLARAMSKGKAKVNPRDASLAALQPYGVSKGADVTGGTPANPSTGAFQSDAFQNDAFQVDGVT